MKENKYNIKVNDNAQLYTPTNTTLKLFLCLIECEILIIENKKNILFLGLCFHTIPEGYQQYHSGMNNILDFRRTLIIQILLIFIIINVYAANIIEHYY